MAILIGNDGDNFIFGTADDDTISGLGGNDSLIGAGGNDTIDGGAGNDTLSGNEGADDLTGGGGDDHYTWRISPAFFGPTESTSLARDNVLDFEGAGVAGGDTMQLVESDGRRMVFEGVAKRSCSSIAIGVMSSIVICTLSPGITISVPCGSWMEPVTSVVRK